MNGHPIVNFFRMASLLMLLVVVALLAAIVTMHFSIHGAEVQVPSLKGMTVADARSLTAGLGLILDVDNRYYSGDVATGHILSQSPAPGMVVRREWKVRVAESLGPQMVDVPSTLGLDQRVAELRLRGAGLAVGATVQLPDANATAGTVLAQDPPAHAQDIAQPTVSLLVAAPDDEEPDGYVMPDLSGLPVVSAQSALAKTGIKSEVPVYISVPVAPVGSGNAAPVPPVRPGTVIAQAPAAGARVDQSTIVRLTVAR
ncbi:MAG TPA: PASTA domain-containing protein [Terracidiphilus sp.]|jgi:eukaryotic-like serine/threonine-protein kinase|nr:PASTA domain-containing protein [Terracidiphilus sp.]